MKLSSQTPLQLLFLSFSIILNKLDLARSKWKNEFCYLILHADHFTSFENLFYNVLDLNPSGDITTTVRTAHSFPQA